MADESGAALPQLKRAVKREALSTLEMMSGSSFCPKKKTVDLTAGIAAAFGLRLPSLEGCEQSNDGRHSYVIDLGMFASHAKMLTFLAKHVESESFDVSGWVEVMKQRCSGEGGAAGGFSGTGQAFLEAGKFPEGLREALLALYRHEISSCPIDSISKSPS